MDDFEDIDSPTDQALLYGDVEEAEKVAEPVAEDEAVKLEEKSADEAPDDDKPARNQSIPRDRFDEVNGKFKAAKEENERLVARMTELEKSFSTPSEQARSLRDMEKEYLSLFMEGDEEKALDMRERINAETIKIAQEAAEQRIEAREQAKVEQAGVNAFDATVSALIAEFPVLDVAGEHGDKDMIDAVVGLRDVYISRGMPAHEALDTAARKLMAKSGNINNAPIVDDPRKAEAIRRGAETSNRQPPMPSGVGNRSVPVAIIPENQDDWESLSKKERERLLS